MRSYASTTAPSRFLVSGLRSSYILLLGAMMCFWALTVEAKGAPESFADLIEDLTPAVVNISTSRNVESHSRIPFDMPPGFPEEFLDDFFGERGDNDRRTERRMSALGSGFVIDPEGYIVTNNHVIEEADEITVTFPDGSKFEAELVGRDEKTDLALLKIEAETDLPHVTFGDSEATRIGDWVVAIGNPFGLEGTVTAGIISGRSRRISNRPYDDYIQTDASINKGNSGGPMFNMDGKVIGINTAIFSPTGGSVGIGFAVPSNLALTVLEDLKEFGETRRGWLGVHIQTVTEDIAESLGLDSAHGALVSDVDAGGPAAEAGLQQGDVILTFDGRQVDEMQSLPRIVAETRVDKSVAVEIWRNGEIETVTVVVARLEEGEVVAEAPELVGNGTTDIDALGLELGSLTDAMRTAFRIGDDVEGVLIVDVDPDSSAADQGIRRGHVIIEIDHQAVSSPEDVSAIIDEVSAEGAKNAVLALIYNGADKVYVGLRFNE